MVIFFKPDNKRYLRLPITLKNGRHSIEKTTSTYSYSLLQIVLAKDTKDLLTKLPPLVIEMIQEHPHTFYATLSCFNYPKINVQACEQVAKVDHPGSAYSKHNLGYANEFGDSGLKQNYSDAFYWYLRAANQGLVSSQYNLARMYEYGHGSSGESCNG